MVAQHTMWHESGHKALPWIRLQTHAPFKTKLATAAGQSMSLCFCPAVENAINHYLDMLTLAYTTFGSLAHITSLTAGWNLRTSTCPGHA